MSQTYYTKLTPVGLAKINEAVASGEALALSALAIGDANQVGYEPTGSETALVNERHRVALASVVPHADNAAWSVAEAVLPADVGGWWIFELAVYDADGDMIAIGNFEPTLKPLAETGQAFSLTLRVVLQAGGGDMTLSVDARSGYATQSYIDGEVALVQDLAGQLDGTVYLRKDDNLSGLANKSTARTNLGVLSSTEVTDALGSKASTAHNHDVAYAAKDHGHAIAEVTGLQTALNGKSSSSHNHDVTYAAKSHSHSISQVTGLQTALDGKAASSHNHDSQYLGKTAKAADADKLDGKNSSEFALVSQIPSGGVEGVRLGAVGNMGIPYSSGIMDCPTGCVFTGIQNSNGSVFYYRYKPVQKQIGGTWYTVSG